MVRLPALAACILLVLSLSTSTHAQPLTDRVPDDAIFYLGWRGADDLGSDFDGSHLKALLEASQVKALTEDLVPRIARRVAMQDEQAAEVIRRVWQVAEPLWHHSTALYFGGVDTTDPEKAHLKIALLCDAGDDAPALLDSLNRFIAEAPESEVQLMAAMDDGVVSLSTYAMNDMPASSLTGNDDFAGCIEKTSKDAVLTMYLDNERLLDFIDLSINTTGGTEAETYWPKVRQALHLDAIKGMVWTSGFDGAEWSDVLWVDAPAPRQGLLAALEGSPISDKSLRLVPEDATIVNVAQLDLGVLMREIRRALNEIDAQAAEQFEKGLSAVSLMIGANVELELISQFGSQWTTYASPSVGGRNWLGMVLLNHLKDPAKVERTTGLVEIAINNTLAGQLKKQKPTPMKVRFERAKIDGLNLHYWAVPLLSPSWAMADGTMYCGFFPQTVIAAAQRGGGSGGSILDNEAFQHLRERLGNGEFHTIQFVDLPAIAPQGYTTLLMLSRLPLGIGDLFGVSTPPLVVPTFDQFRPHLGPMGSATRVNDKGFLFKSISPFPGAGVFAMDGGLLSGNPVQLLAAIGPAIEEARKSANEVRVRQRMQQQDEIPDEAGEGFDSQPARQPERPLRPRPGPRQ